VVAANAGLAIHTFNPERSYQECVEEASETLVSGKASGTLSQLISMN